MKEVLIVDDSASMRQLIETTLAQGGYDVTSAEDGVDALEKAGKHRYSLVITDVNMPRMNGLSLVGKLRELSEYKYTPILVLTTETSKEKKKEAKSAGATGWLTKPFDPRKLLETVGKVVN
ncbi:MAG: response regulator [Myxococcota bacterium]